MNSGKIFISYRREDTSGESGRLKDRLEQVFGSENIFYDVETLEAGLNFDQSIDKALSESKVLLAMIGPHWLRMTDSKGVQRLQKEDDWVRLEISAALKRNIRVIPVLVNGADMPDDELLPDDLKGLALKHAQELSSSRWNYDVGELTKVLEKIIDKKTQPKSQPQQRPDPIPFTPPAPQPKGWFAKNYLWVIGIFLLLGVIGMCSEAIDNYPVDDYSTNTSADPAAVQGSQDNPVYSESDNQPTQAYIPNMAGNWALYLNGQLVSTLTFRQNGINLDYSEHDLVNNRTGEGKGQVSAETLILDYYSTTSTITGTMTMNTSNSGQSWAGSIYFPVTAVTAPIELIKN
jgi:hypothetical protein